MKHKALKTPLVLLSVAVLLIFFNSCKKIDDDLLTGAWVLIDIGNIHNELQYEWHFFEGKIDVFKLSKTDASNQVHIGQGSYLLKTKLTNATLIVVDFVLYGQDIYEYNMEWKVNKMTDTQMIISGRKDAGLEYKEFVRKQ